MIVGCGDGDGKYGTFGEDEIPSDLAVGESRYESVEAINALSSSMCDDRWLGVGLGGDGEGVVLLGKNFHLDALVSSMSSHPDLSSSVRGGGAGYFATRLDMEPLAACPRDLEWLVNNQHIRQHA